MKIIIMTSLMVIFAITLCFTSEIETLLYLKPNVTFLNHQDLEIHFIDVGQGDAIAIRYPDDTTMLVDAGPVTAKRMLTTYLDNIFFSSNKNKKFDYVVLTHTDNDHSGNMKTILENYTVDNFYRPEIKTEGEDVDFEVVSKKESYIDAIEIAYDKNIDIHWNKTGNYLNFGNASITWLAPSKIEEEANINSAILYLEYFHQGVLLTGDAEYEEVMSAVSGLENCKVDILKVGHHGSKNALVKYDDNKVINEMNSIFEIISPSYAIISVGEDNSYDHPNSYTLQKLSQIKIDVDNTLLDQTYLTSENGNVVACISHTIQMHELGKTNKYVYVSYLHIVGGIEILLVMIILIPSCWKKDFEQSKNQKI